MGESNGRGETRRCAASPGRRDFPPAATLPISTALMFVLRAGRVASWLSDRDFGQIDWPGVLIHALLECVRKKVAVRTLDTTRCGAMTAVHGNQADAPSGGMAAEEIPS